MMDRQTRYQMGPGGLVFVMSTGLIYAAALYTQANLLFWGFGLMIGAALTSMLHAVIALRGLEVQRLPPNHAIADEPVMIRYRLHNRSRLPMFSVMITELWGHSRRDREGPVHEDPARLRGGPHGYVIHIGARQSVQAEAPCWPLRRGRLTFDRVAVSSSFPFGIIRKQVAVVQRDELIVFPHLYQLNRQLLTDLERADSYSHADVDQVGGHEEFFGLREYRAGDSLKRVDWKRTARTGEMVAREMTRPRPPRLAVLLDLTPNAPGEAGDNQQALTERALSLTASLICQAHLQGYRVGLSVAGVDCQTFTPRHSRPHRAQMLQALAQLDTARPRRGPSRQASRPSVIVRPDGDEQPGSRRRLAIRTIHASQLSRYITEGDAPPAPLLDEPRPDRSARREMAGAR